MCKKNSSKKNEEKIAVFSPCCWKWILTVALIVVLCVFSIVVISIGVKNLQTLETKTVYSVDNQESEISTEYLSIEGEFILLKSYINNDQKNIKHFERVYLTIIILYGVLFVGVIVALCYALSICDGGIRFAKLNELHDLRESVLENEDKELSDVNIVEETCRYPANTKEVNVILDDNKQDYELNINYNVPVTKKEKNKNLEFLKNYMNAIVEI